MKKLKSSLQERADAGDEAAKARLDVFESQAQTFAKKIIGNFKDYEFFTGESMDPDGMVVLMNYREDGVTPYMIYWRDGLKEVSILVLVVMARTRKWTRADHFFPCSLSHP